MDYNRSRLHYDRSRFLLGAYILKPYARTEEHIKAMHEAGVDCLFFADPDRDMLDKLAKYGMGAYVWNIVPFWSGGRGENAGKLHETVTVEDYERIAAEFADHPAIWGIDIGDEPSALDFPHYKKLVEAAYRLFPNQFPFLNLYPNYAQVSKNTDDETISQLGTPTYAEHLDKYFEYIDTDYLCYDYYMYSASVHGAYENLCLAADRCRRFGRDLWIVLQVNSLFPEKWISENQLRHQAYTAMAFGVRAISWACWTAGWWSNQVLDENGEKTQQYDKLYTVNHELRAMGDPYMAYRNRSTHFLGFAADSESMTDVPAPAENGVTLGCFENVTADGGCALAGYMTAEDGREALLLADAADPQDNAPVEYTLRLACTKPLKALKNGAPLELTCENGVYAIPMGGSCGVLVMAE